MYSHNYIYIYLKKYSYQNNFDFLYLFELEYIILNKEQPTKVLYHKLYIQLHYKKLWYHVYYVTSFISFVLHVKCNAFHFD